MQLKGTRRLPLIVVLALAMACSNGAQTNGTGQCGEPPELSYTCADGVFPCKCVDHGDGTAQWHCEACPPVDCNANPKDKACEKDSSCIACHGLASSEGGVGIENAHPWSYLGCTDCHGGKGRDDKDPTRKLTKEEAHVHIPHSIAQDQSVTTPKPTAYENYYLARAGVERLEGGAEWIRFMNPGDLRAVDATCGRSGCHDTTAQKVKRSVMSTVVGKLDAMLYAVGLPRVKELASMMGHRSKDKRRATYASLDTFDPNFDESKDPPGAVKHVRALTTVDRESEKPYGTFTEEDLFKETINKLCGTCHLGHNGTNANYGNFRSSGCTACHMPYSYAGRSQSGDPMINKTEPTYPAAYSKIQYPERPHATRHQLQRTMTSQECLACHTGSARSVFQYMGIRTDDNRDLTRAKQAGANIDFKYSNLIDNQRVPEARLHGFTQDQLIEYEDLDGDGQDDTPGDVHWVEGRMECIDCHPSSDMHGDGKIYSRQNQAVKVRCVHCHGNLEYPADPDAKDNPVNELYFATGKVARKTLWKFDRIPAHGEEGYPAVKTTGTWLKTKSRGEWRYVPQIRWGAQWDPGTKECVGDGRRVNPGGGFACSPASSIAHGRWQGLNKAAGHFDDGVGPRPGVEVVLGADGTSSSVRLGFSHLGEPTQRPNQEPTGGLECNSCHATWHNMRYGNHLGLKDFDGGERLYDWDRVTGQVTLGTQGWFNFTFVDILDQQLGVNPKGKIGWLVPTRLKLFVRQLVLNPAINSAVDFMKQVGDANFPWKTYRDRVGFGNLRQGAAGNIRNAPGFAQICLEQEGYCDEDPLKDQNGGLGSDPNQPHATQRRPRDCVSCHLGPAGEGLARVGAVFGWNPNGFTAETSAYLRRIKQVVAPHGTYSTQDGFVIADDGIKHRLDWMVDEKTGYPLVYTMHGRTDDGKDGRPGRGYETYDPEAAGPIPKGLIETLKRIRVKALYP